MGFAILMGSNVPLSVSLLNDYTMPDERGLAQSIYAAGVYLGVGMSNISVAIDNAAGWRNCIRYICLISWALVIPMFFVPEPERNETNRLAAELAKEEADKANFAHIEMADEAVDGQTPNAKPLL